LSDYSSNLMVLLEKGRFLMGSAPRADVHRDEVPQHTVVFPHSFQLSRVPITQAFFQLVMNYNPSRSVGKQLPVESVSWFEAIEFCNRLSSLLHLQPCYEIFGREVHWNRNNNGYRLPTEAEWEFASRRNVFSEEENLRNTASSALYSGSNKLDSVAWYLDNCDAPKPVGQKEPNQVGLYDMSGNVFEWCFDWWGSYPERRQTDPMGALEGNTRVCRGGAWNLDAWCARSSFRYAEVPSAKCANIGFRIARSQL